MKSPKFCQKTSVCRFDLVQLSKSSFKLAIRNSKTNQFGQKVLIIPFAVSPVAALCPVKALIHHLTISKLPSTYPLFAYSNGQKTFVLTQESFSKKLREVILSIGINPSTYSPHSFRRGGTSYAINSGINPMFVKARGDWSSNAFEKYVYLSGAICLLCQF